MLLSPLAGIFVGEIMSFLQLLPTAPFVMGAVLPPHLSPFVVEEEGDYVPAEKKGPLL